EMPWVSSDGVNGVDRLRHDRPCAGPDGSVQPPHQSLHQHLARRGIAGRQLLQHHPTTTSVQRGHRPAPDAANWHGTSASRGERPRHDDRPSRSVWELLSLLLTRGSRRRHERRRLWRHGNGHGRHRYGRYGWHGYGRNGWWHGYGRYGYGRNGR